MVSKYSIKWLGEFSIREMFKTVSFLLICDCRNNLPPKTSSKLPRNVSDCRSHIFLPLFAISKSCTECVLFNGWRFVITTSLIKHKKWDLYIDLRIFLMLHHLICITPVWFQLLTKPTRSTSTFKFSCSISRTQPAEGQTTDNSASMVLYEISSMRSEGIFSLSVGHYRPLDIECQKQFIILCFMACFSTSIIDRNIKFMALCCYCISFFFSSVIMHAPHFIAI